MECKDEANKLMIFYDTGFNRYIVECKDGSLSSDCLEYCCFNRYIVECKADQSYQVYSCHFPF